MAGDTVKVLQQRLEDHIEEYREHLQEEHEKWEHLFAVQEANNQAIKDLTRAVSAQAESTKDLVSAWETTNSVIKVGSMLGRFGKWLTSVAILGAGIAWVMEHWD